MGTNTKFLPDQMIRENYQKNTMNNTILAGSQVNVGSLAYLIEALQMSGK